MSFTKLHSSLLASTVWNAPDHVRLVWITLLAMADQDGLVEASIPGLAVLARLSVESTREAVTLLESPDADSRSKEHDGRRILPTDGGWQIVTYQKHRERSSPDERKAKAAERVRKWRERKRNAGNVSVTEVRHADADAEAEAEGESDARARETPLASDGMTSAEARPEHKAFERSWALPVAKWPHTPADEAFATTLGLDPIRELERFRDHHSARATRLREWSAEWRNWCRRGAERPSTVQSNGNGTAATPPEFEQRIRSGEFGAHRKRQLDSGAVTLAQLWSSYERGNFSSRPDRRGGSPAPIVAVIGKLASGGRP